MSKQVVNAMVQAESSDKSFISVLRPHIEEIATKHKVTLRWVGDAAFPEGEPDNVGAYIREVNLFLWEA